MGAVDEVSVIFDNKGRGFAVSGEGKFNDFKDLN